MMNALTILGLVFAALFLLTGIRAMIFANRHKDQFADRSVLEKSAWWLRLFRKDGFGVEAEAERRRLATMLIVFGGLFFVTGGLIQLFLVPAQ
jgi:hypothetical protein